VPANQADSKDHLELAKKLMATLIGLGKGADEAFDSLSRMPPFSNELVAKALLIDNEEILKSREDQA